MADLNQILLVAPDSVTLQYNRPENDIKKIVCIDRYSENDVGGWKTKVVTAFWDSENGWCGVNSHWQPQGWMPLPDAMEKLR